MIKILKGRFSIAFLVLGFTSIGEEAALADRDERVSNMFDISREAVVPNNEVEKFYIPKHIHSPVQVKDPYTGSILMHVGSSCKHIGVSTRIKIQNLNN